MGTGYTRNDTTNNIADGNVINAADLDGEFDAIVTALSTGGHTHDGTAAEGGPVTVVGPAQDVVVSANTVTPKTDNTLDLGTSSLEFKDLYLDGTAHIDTLDVDENANIDGNLAIGGTLTVTGTTTFNGGTITLGDAATDNVVFAADVDSSIIPDDDDTYDLGSASQEWRNLFIDGTANIDTASIDNISDDTLVATDKKIQFRDTAIFINSSADGQLDIVSDTEIQIAATTIDINGAVNASGEIIAASLDISGNVDIDGVTNLDVVDIDGAVDMASTLAVTGIATFTDDIIIGDGKTIGSTSDIDAITIAANGQVTLTQTLIGTALDISGDIDVDGITNLDVVDIDGAVNMATTALVTGVLTTTATQVATGGITSGSNIVSDTDSTDDLGTTSVRWANLFVDGITATDQITATGFTGTLDGILGSGAAAAATVTTLDASGVVNLNLATDSTSSTSGALIVDGGVGIAKKLFVGTDLAVDGTTNLDATNVVGTLAVTGSATISSSSGDTLTLTKDTTEPSLRIEGDSNKDFVFTVSGELLTLTQNDGTTDIVTFDHDSKAASFSGVVSADNYTVAAGGVYTTASGNDLNIVYPDGRSLFIKEAGTTHVTVDNSGNVGIGNTNPNLPLTLTCNSAANALALRARTNDDYSFMQFYNNAGSTLRGQISNHNGAMSFHTGNSAAQRLHISTAGYVTTASQTSFYATRTGNYTGYNASASGGSSLEVILYNGSTYNTGNGFDGGNGRFTAPVAGVYYFRAETYTGGTAFGQSWFVVNGSRAPGTDMVYGAATQIIGNSGILKLNANDWVGFHPYAQNSNLTINAHANHTWFRGHLLG